MRQTTLNLAFPTNKPSSLFTLGCLSGHDWRQAGEEWGSSVSPAHQADGEAGRPRGRRTAFLLQVTLPFPQGYFRNQEENTKCVWPGSPGFSLSRGKATWKQTSPAGNKPRQVCSRGWDRLLPDFQTDPTFPPASHSETPDSSAAAVLRAHTCSHTRRPRCIQSHPPPPLPPDSPPSSSDFPAARTPRACRLEAPSGKEESVRNHET